jgi:hypothetical protein
VHLERLPPVHFVTGGVFVSPELGDSGLIAASAELQALQPTETAATVEQPVMVSFTLRTHDGAVVAQNSSALVAVAPGGTVLVAATLPAVGVTPWSAFTFDQNKTVHSPKSTYRMTVSITPAVAVDGPVPLIMDEVNVTCGFRKTAWREKFWLNGNETQLRGFSHHDSFAGVGVAMPARVFLFHAQVNRALGGNFWRTPPWKIDLPCPSLFLSVCELLG